MSWHHGDYACGHWLPSLSTPKAWRIRINEVGMLTGCQTHAGCCLVMPAEYRQLVLDRRQPGKFNLENTGQSLMRHQLSMYRVKWAHWQCMTSISLKATWQRAQYNTVQHVANSGNTGCGCTSLILWWHYIYLLLFVCFLSINEYIYIYVYWQWKLRFSVNVYTNNPGQKK